VYAKHPDLFAINLYRTQQTEEEAQHKVFNFMAQLQIPEE
jgi:hypothetical protein